MPRKKIGVGERPRRTDGSLVERLVAELKSVRVSGQPIINEQEYSTGLLNVTVIWDDWDRLRLEDRTETILRAYEEAEGLAYRDRIALASGLTVPEAHAAGMLPYRIITARRTTDKVTLGECQNAMIDEGASILFSPDLPQLLFSTIEEAEAALDRLSKRLPGSEAVWIITQELGRGDDWSQN